MAYKVTYHLIAKSDIAKCEETYRPTSLPKRLHKWLVELSEEAESKDWKQSKNINDLLERSEQISGLIGSLPRVGQIFWEASLLTKIRGILMAISSRRLPYDIRISTKCFRVFTETCSVTVIYLADHVKKRIVVMEVEGLPMQGYE